MVFLQWSKPKASGHVNLQLVHLQEEILQEACRGRIETASTIVSWSCFSNHSFVAAQTRIVFETDNVLWWGVVIVHYVLGVRLFLFALDFRKFWIFSIDIVEIIVTSVSSQTNRQVVVRLSNTAKWPIKILSLYFAILSWEIMAYLHALSKKVASLTLHNCVCKDFIYTERSECLQLK